MDAYKDHSATRSAAGFSHSLVVLSLSLALMVVGCKSKPAAATDDASLNAKVASSLAADQNLSGQAIQTSVSGGVVTLSGNVASDTVRTIATGDVAQIAGVKTVVDNLVVQSAAAAPLPPAPAAATQPVATVSSAKAKKPTPVVAAVPPAPAPAPIIRNTPAPAVVKVTPPPPPPPAPVVHFITLPVGTSIPVAITQALDSATAKAGDKFTGVVSNDVTLDGTVVLAQGTPVTGHVDVAQDAAHFKGSSLLTISLSAIDRKGVHLEVSTESYTKKGEGRGKNTAEKVGGGAAVGAIIGGIFGGGKGAAIGAAAGGGVGAGANSVTRGQQVQIPSETVVRFRLLEPVTVRVSGTGGNYSSSLEHRDQ
jgi:hypothetical protein